MTVARMEVVQGQNPQSAIADDLGSQGLVLTLALSFFER